MRSKVGGLAIAVVLLMQALPAAALGTGDVVASVRNGGLVLVGDDADNDVTITPGGAQGELIVEGNGDTTVNGVAGPVTFDGIDDDIRAEIGTGSDRVTMESVAIPDDIRLYLGPGDDDVEIIDTQVGDRVSIDGAQDRDAVVVIGGSILGDLRIDYGHGGSGTTIADSRGLGGPQIGGGLRIEAGDGADNMTIVGGVKVDGYTRIDIGDGGTYAIFSRLTLGKFDFEAADGEERLDIIQLEAGKVTLDLGRSDSRVVLQGSTLHDDIRLFAGAGTDRLSTAANTVDGDVRIDFGDGGSNADLGLEISGDLYLWSGSEDDLLRIDGSTTVGGKTKIDQGPGDDNVEIGYAQFDGKVSIKERSGDDNVALEGTSFGSNLSINTGAGIDRVVVGGSAAGSGIAVNGRTWIKLNAGDDALQLVGSTFVGRFYADGGAGVDIYDAAEDNTFGGKVKVKRFEPV